MPADRAISSPSVSFPRGSGPRCAVLAGCLLLLAACGGGLAPVHNVRAPVVAPHGQATSVHQVRDAVLQALVSRSWQVDREGPDGIVATIVSRGHSATVLIQFDANSYGISYLDSSKGLKFNGAAIHRRYNDWIDRLDSTIRKLLASGEPYPYRAAQPVPAAPPAAGPLPGQPAPATVPQQGEPAPAIAPAPAPPPAGAPPVAPPGGPYEAPPPPPPPATAPRR